MRYKRWPKGASVQKKKKKVGGGFHLFLLEIQLASTMEDAVVTEELVS